MKQIIVLVIVVIVTAGVAGGAGYMLGNQNGMTQAQNVRNEFFQQRTGQTGQAGVSGNFPTPAPGQTPGAAFIGRGGAGGVTGVVKSINNNTIELTMQDGSTVTVKTDSNTVVQKSTAGTLADIKANTRITVNGDSSSGTTTARIIQIVSGGQ